MTDKRAALKNAAKALNDLAKAYEGEELDVGFEILEAANRLLDESEKGNELNKLVASGEYERVYVCELEPGDIIVGYKVVDKIERVTDNFIKVFYEDGSLEHYGRALSTTLIKA